MNCGSRTREIVDRCSRADATATEKLPMSAADMKAARKFRTRYPGAAGIVDFVRLNPMDLVVHQLWISTAIAERYGDKVTPDKWLHTALLDPPSNPRLLSRTSGDNITFDLPHAEFFFTVPSQTNEIRVSEGDGFVTVALHANRAMLLRGYHRTFACAQFVREAQNAPHGVLFAVSNQLETIGNLADDVLHMMAGPRPPQYEGFLRRSIFPAGNAAETPLPDADPLRGGGDRFCRSRSTRRWKEYISHHPGIRSDRDPLIAAWTRRGTFRRYLKMRCGCRQPNEPTKPWPFTSAPFSCARIPWMRTTILASLSSRRANRRGCDALRKCPLARPRPCPGAQ